MPTRAVSNLPTFEQLPADQDVDLIIVGAGVAGLYTAWKMLTEHPGLRIVLVERLNRTGGRLDTDLIRLGGSTVRDEEGGMRFTEAMLELYGLIDALDLRDQIVPFPLTDPRDRYYVRGQSFTVEEANANPGIWGSLYNLAPSEQDKSPGSIVAEIYDRLLRENDQDPETVNPTPEFWQKFRLEYKWKEKTLNQWQLWGLIRNMGYTEQCVTMLSHTLGFIGPFLSLANAGEAFQILEDFPAKAMFHTFKDGFSTIPDALVHRIGSLDGKIFLSCDVQQINGTMGSYRVELTEATPPERQSSPFPSPTAVGKQIRAPRVVLAVASNALRTLYATSPALHQQSDPPRLWANLSSVQEMRLMKINLYYDQIWWTKSESSNNQLLVGHSFSDTALGSVYPFYALNNPVDSPAALTIYCDFYNIDFWQGLQNIEPLFEPEAQKAHNAPPQVLFPASEAVVAEATSQFQKLFDVEKVPLPVLTSFRSWDGEDQFGYAYHQWGLGADDKCVIEDLIEPVPGIYTCNESYSDMQGWVNGSLRSADRMLPQLRKVLKS